MNTTINQQGIFTMTSEQTIFNKVAAHLLTQREQSLNADGRCSYRGQNGRRCAVGCLINDEHYHSALGDKTIATYAVRQAVKNSLGLPRLSPRLAFLLEELQILHDYTPPSAWREGLEELAHKYDLELTV